MFIDISKLPNWAKLEISKEDLLAFADKIRKQSGESQPPQPVSEILSIDEVAEFLKLARQTIYGLCNRRAIPFYKKNKRLYFKRSELLLWIEEGKKKTQSDFDKDLDDYLTRDSRK